MYDPGRHIPGIYQVYARKLELELESHWQLRVRVRLLGIPDAVMPGMRSPLDLRTLGSRLTQQHSSVSPGIEYMT